MKRTLLSLFILLTAIAIHAQNETNNWYFGNNAGLNFNSGTAVAASGGALNMQEGCGAISDNNGNLLFYTDGMKVWNRSLQQMLNGYGLVGAPSSGQTGLVITKPGSTTIFYIFTVDENARSRGLRYSTVDMSLDGGMGDITEKNTLLFAPATEKMAAVKHANGVDLWFVCHKWESNEFVSYLVTETGILNASPIVSKVGTVHEGHVSRSRGYMKLSPRGDKLALAIESMNRFELYDFNNLTGTVSNPLIFPDNYVTAYGVEFSPDGKFLYGSERWGDKLYQFDISSGNLTTILASQTLLANGNAKGIQLASDGKIYVANTSGMIGVVNNPTDAGSASNYNAYSQNVSGSSLEGLPGFVASSFDKVNFTWKNNCPGSETEFKLINPTGVLSVTWYFEYPSATPQNVSTIFNPTHVYSAGTYEVRLTAHI